MWRVVVKVRGCGGFLTVAVCFAMNLGGVFRAFEGDPTFSTLRNVKNQDIQSNINNLLGSYGGATKATNDALSNFTTSWNASAPSRTAQTNREAEAIGGFYNGQVAQTLKDLRESQKQAQMDATNQAINRATRGFNSSLVGGGGPGPSSWQTRANIGINNDALTQAALAAAQNERSDLGYLLGNQAALSGRANDLIQNNLQSSLVPTTLQNSSLAGLINALSGITNLDQQNSFWGLQQDTTDLGKIAGILDAVQSSIMTTAGTAGNLYGGMGGGGGGGGM